MDTINYRFQKNNSSISDEFDIDDALEIAEEAARIGGKIIRERFGETSDMRLKRGIEVQTPTDIEVEREITSLIENFFFDHSIVGEESGIKHGRSPYTWIIDPLDGTSNFVLDIPQIAVCITLKKYDEILMTVIHQPIVDITYTAKLGEGTRVNGKPTCLQPREKSLAKSTICSILTYSMHDNPLTHSFINKLYRSTRRLLDTWAPSLDWCMLATGKIDALVSLSDAQLWIDPGMLAGAFLFRESGGLISDLNGDVITDIARLTSVVAASSSSMIKQITRVIACDPLVIELSG